MRACRLPARARGMPRLRDACAAIIRNNVRRYAVMSSIVYFTRDISARGLMAIYDALGVELRG